MKSPSGLRLYNLPVLFFRWNLWLEYGILPFHFLSTASSFQCYWNKNDSAHVAGHALNIGQALLHFSSCRQESIWAWIKGHRIKLIKKIEKHMFLYSGGRNWIPSGFVPILQIHPFSLGTFVGSISAWLSLLTVLRARCIYPSSILTATSISMYSNMVSLDKNLLLVLRLIYPNFLDFSI